MMDQLAWALVVLVFLLLDYGVQPFSGLCGISIVLFVFGLLVYGLGL